MTVNHDARPASRYRAVTLGAYRDATTAPDRSAVAPRRVAPGRRVLRAVPAQLVRLDLTG